MTKPRRIVEREEELEKMIAIISAIDDAILGRAKKDVSHYEIETSLGKRRLDKIPLPELLKTRDYYYEKIAQLRNEIRRENSRSASRQVLVRF